MGGKSRPASVSWTPRASRTRTPPIRRAMTRAKRCPESSVISRWTPPGLPHAIPVTTADVTDRAGALAMFDENRADLNRVQNVLVDGGYTGKPFAAAVQGILGASVEVVKRSELHTFVVLPKRWVVERSFAWLEKCRRLWKNCERKLNTSLQMVVLAFATLILRRLQTGSYEVVRVEGVEIGVIEIPIQDRPAYAENDYGKVKARVVYFRAGSSTREATPEEIARMGAQQSLEATPNLVLSWADAGKRRLLSSPYLADRLLLEPRLPANTFDSAARPLSVMDRVTFAANDTYSQELIEYCFQQALYVPLGLALTNESRSAARRVRFVGSIPRSAVEILEYLEPLPQPDLLVFSPPHLMLPTGDEVQAQFRRSRDRWEISVDFGDIRPRETVFTHSPIWLAVAVSSVVELRGDLFADNLPEPIQCSLEVRFRVEQRRMERDDAPSYLRQ